MAVTATYRTKYKIGDEVCIRSDLCDCVAYTSDDGAIVAFPPSNTYMYFGASATIRDIERGRYVLENVAGVRIPGLWVDGMLEVAESYVSAERIVESSGYSFDQLKHMLPEVAAYFASTGMSLEQWEQEFRKGTKRIREMIAFDKIARIAKLTRQAHDATEEGKDASNLFEQIADVASEKEEEYKPSKGEAVVAVTCFFLFAAFLSTVACALALTPYTFLTVAFVQKFFTNFFTYLPRVIGYMLPVWIILFCIVLKTD